MFFCNVYETKIINHEKKKKRTKLKKEKCKYTQWNIYDEKIHMFTKVIKICFYLFVDIRCCFCFCIHCRFFLQLFLFLLESYTCKIRAKKKTSPICSILTCKSKGFYVCVFLLFFFFLNYIWTCKIHVRIYIRMIIQLL